MRAFSLTANLLASILSMASCFAGSNPQPLTHLINDKSLALESVVDARLPAHSRATVGEISRHPIKNLAFSFPLFVIGNDDYSRDWLHDHLPLLKQLHALGFITNITHTDDLDELQTLAQLPLLPANVDELFTLIGVNHYPVIIANGEVWQ